MAIADHMPKDPKWYQRMAELEDGEIGAGIMHPDNVGLEATWDYLKEIVGQPGVSNPKSRPTGLCGENGG